MTEGAQRRALRFARPICDPRARGLQAVLVLVQALILAGAACAAPRGAAGEEDVEAADWRAEPPRLIAHGGGAVGGLHVTNSLQALEHAAAEGFALIEVDLCWTTDGHLVLLHDWGGAFQAMFGGDPGPRSLEDFLGLEATAGLQQLDLDGLAAWMAEHPRVGIVTDIKTERRAGLQVLAERLAAVRAQVVPQVHDEAELRHAYGLGFDAVILTLYASAMSDDEVLELVNREPLYAVTVPKERALDGLARRFSEAGVTCFAHTVNNQLMATRLVRSGAHGVYTDRLTPARSRRDARRTEDSWIIASEPAESGPGPRSLLIVDLWDSLDSYCGTLAVRSTAPGEATSPVTLQASLGDGSPPSPVEVTPDAEPVPLHAMFSDGLPMWIAAPPDVELELRWQLLERMPLLRRSTRELPSAWTARGPVDELGGLALFLLNPGPESRAVEILVDTPGAAARVMERVVEPGVVSVNRLPLEGLTGTAELSVTGGGVAVHLLRAGPECSVVR